MERGTVSEERSDSPFVGNWTIAQSYTRWDIRVKADLNGTFEDGTDYSGKLNNVKAASKEVAFEFVVDTRGFGIDIQFEGKVDGDKLDALGMGDGFEFPIEAECA